MRCSARMGVLVHSGLSEHPVDIGHASSNGSVGAVGSNPDKTGRWKSDVSFSVSDGRGLDRLQDDATCEVGGLGGCSPGDD